MNLITSWCVHECALILRDIVVEHIYILHVNAVNPELITKGYNAYK